MFTRIIDGELPGVFLHRDDVCASFLSINPLADGHALVVPRLEVDEWTDLPRDVAEHVFDVSRRIGRAQKSAFGCLRVGLIVAGFEVPHCHLHVIPSDSMGNLSFENARTTVERDELERCAGMIRSRLTDEGIDPVST